MGGVWVHATDTSEETTESGWRVAALAFERLPTTRDNTRLPQVKETVEAENRIGVTPRELVVGHDAEARQVAQSRNVQWIELWMYWELGYWSTPETHAAGVRHKPHSRSWSTRRRAMAAALKRLSRRARYVTLSRKTRFASG